MGSLSSYQFSHTESNFDVAIDIDTVARHETYIQEIESFPHFPLNIRERVKRATSVMRRKILSGNSFV